MKPRLLTILVFLLLVAAIAKAQVYQITTHTIEMDIDKDGKAEITEKFFLSFPNEFHLQLFRDESEKMGVDLSAWEQFNAAFKPSIGKSGNVMVSDIGFVENDSKYLEMKYTLNEPLMQKEKETSRMVEFSLNSKFFDNFIEGSFWVIPNTMTIIMDLPLQAEVQQPIKPGANVSGNRIVWTGYKSTNVMLLKYTLWKQIASITLNEAVEMLVNSELLLPLLMGIALIAVAILLRRKEIATSIEEYIIQHSDLSNMEEEE